MTTERELVQWAGSLRLSPSPQADARILAAAGAAINRTLTPTPMYKSIARLAVTAAALIGIAVLAWHLVYIPARSNRSTPPAIVTNASSEPNQATATPANQAEQLAKELALAQQRFSEKDVAGLIDLLENGLGQTQVKVAGYLAELDAAQAVPVLQRLAAAWTGDPNANPFAQAMARIKPASLEPNHPPIGQSQAKARTIRVQVLEKATGLPLACAQVCTNPCLDQRRDYICDANGLCRVELGEAPPESFHIIASKPGYVAMQIRFNKPSERDLPKTFSFALEPGICIGGIIEDVNGVPIEGVNVSFCFDTQQQHGLDPFPHLNIVERRTDATGRWSFDGMPADVLGLLEDATFDVSIEHDDYAQLGFRVNDTATVKALLEQNYRVTLYKGSTLLGRVLTTQGEPISGAKVSYRSHEICTTGPDGVFAIPHIHPGQTDIPLEIQAKGYARMQQWIEGYRPDMVPVEIMLRPGHVLSGFVTDTGDTPVADVSVEIHTRNAWGQIVHTDTKGGFATEALDTEDAVGVSVSKDGFMSEHRYVKPTDEPLRFVLHKPLHVSGRVVDALTGGPIERFAIRPCTVGNDNGKILWNPDTTPGQAGHYDHTFTRFSERGYVLAIEADGYLPVESRILDPNEQGPFIDLALVPGRGPAGIVVDVNGLPVAAALVYTSPEYGPHIFWEQGSVTSRNPKTKTDVTGQFSFQPLYQLRHLVAIADEGICGLAVSDLEPTGRMVLQSWAEVRGTVRIADAPARNWPIEMRSLPEVRDTCGYETYYATHSDDQGTFQIKRVPPGGFTLLGKTYQVAPDQVLTLDLIVDPNALL